MPSTKINHKDHFKPKKKPKSFSLSSSTKFSSRLAIIHKLLTNFTSNFYSRHPRSPCPTLIYLLLLLTMTKSPLDWCRFKLRFNFNRDASEWEWGKVVEEIEGTAWEIQQHSFANLFTWRPHHRLWAEEGERAESSWGAFIGTLSSTCLYCT